MGFTSGEAITAAGRFYLGSGIDTIQTDQNLREKAQFLLQERAKLAWIRAPWWWRTGDGTVTSVTTSGTLPSDFSGFGDDGIVYVGTQPLEWSPMDEIQRLRLEAPSTGTPWLYSLHGRTSAGLPSIEVYPTGSSATLTLKNYVKRCPDMVDRPLAPTVAVGAATGLTGTYTWRLTYVTAAGETEGGVVSSALTLANEKASLTALPVSPLHAVTSRKLYRSTGSTSVNGPWLLVTTIADNTSTTYTDSLADGSLGVAHPSVSTAITGMEQFPEDVHESVLVRGLIAALARSQGDVREKAWEDAWETEVKRAWGEYRQGRNTIQTMPVYGQRAQANRSVRSRFTI